MVRSSATRADAHDTLAAVPDRRGVVRGQERDQLAVRFGAVLRAERTASGLTQGQLAERAGLARCTIERLETGRQRPSTATTWKIACALRPLDERGTLALDARLRIAAGSSLREFSMRLQRKRQRLAAKFLVDSDMPVTASDDFGAYAMALVAVSDG